MARTGANVEIEGLRKRFGAVHALRSASCVVEPSGVTALIGRDGAGKTTLLRILLGLVRADAGTATIDGQRYAELSEPSSTVGVVLADAPFDPAATARDELLIAARAVGVPPGRVDELLRAAELVDAANRRCGELTLGMRQRLAIAAALLTEPRLVVLDEPFIGLDPQGVRWLRQLLRDLAADGCTVFVATSLLGEIEPILDDVIVLDEGRVRVHGTPYQLTAGTQQVVVRTPEVERTTAVLAEAGMLTTRTAEGVIAKNADPDEVGELLSAYRIIVHELSVRRARLEDVVLELSADRAGRLESRSV